MEIRSATTSIVVHETQQVHQPGNGLALESSGTQADEAVIIAKLRAQDLKVRAHEQAHQAAAAGLAKGGANFTFERGPDGKQYAVAGEVSIDTAPVPEDQEATIRKARQIRAAALAPADPSPQDRAVASQATAMEAQAKQELNQKNRQEKADSETDTVPEPRRIDLYI